jgi:protein ImuA
MPRDPLSLAALRRLVAEPVPGPDRLPPIRLGAAIDRALPGGGLARGGLHEVAGAGPEVEHAASACLFVAAALADAVAHAGAEAGAPGVVLWVAPGTGVYPPALAAAGLHPDRVIYAEAGRPAGVLLAMEDALRHAGLAGVVGELSGRLSLTASRRLQLAAEASGVPAFLLRRSRRFDDPALAEPCAAVTRWRLTSLPSAPPLPEAPWVRGLGRSRWRLDLIRCRGAEPATWMVEAPDAQGRLGVPAPFSDRPAAPGVARRVA